MTIHGGGGGITRRLPRRVTVRLITPRCGLSIDSMARSSASALEICSWLAAQLMLSRRDWEAETSLPSLAKLWGGDLVAPLGLADLKPRFSRPRNFFLGGLRGRVRKLDRLFMAGELLASHGTPGLADKLWGVVWSTIIGPVFAAVGVPRKLSSTKSSMYS